MTGKDGGPLQYQGIDAPAKETREELAIVQSSRSSGGRVRPLERQGVISTLHSR